MKYSILVVDDEHGGRTSLKILLENEFWAHIQSLSFSKTFEEAKTKLQTNQFDIIFLDINLKGISAFDLLSFIPNASKVVFITAYSEHMQKAIRSKAFDYLVKPIKDYELKECLLRLQQELNTDAEGRVLHIKQKGLTRIIKFSDIFYIEGNGPYSILHLKDDTLTTARTIKSMLPELGDSFVRIHKTYVVNRNFIKGFNKDKLILQNEECLPVSRTGSKNLSH